MNNLLIGIERTFWRNAGYAVHLRRRFENGDLHVAMPLSYTCVPRDSPICNAASMELSQEEAQRFMDELWHVGIRPTEGSGSAGSLAATQRHLEDLRALVFKGKVEPQKKST